MSLATRCPACGTTFRVHAAQLAARGGRVRCGKCAAVFDGVAALLEHATDRVALEPSPQLGLFDPSRRPPSAAAQAPAAGQKAEALPLPEFMAKDRPPRRAATWAWAFLAFLAALGLAAQVTYRYRAELAAYVPSTRTPLEATCAALGCTVPLPRRADLMSIDSSELQADPLRRGIIVLDAVLRNRARFPQDYPALELTLTDESERPVVRRVLTAAEYLGAARAGQRASGIPAGGVASLRVHLDAGGTNATGYRLYLFYPS